MKAGIVVITARWLSLGDICDACWRCAAVRVIIKYFLSTDNLEGSC